MENDLEQVAVVIITSKAVVNNYNRKDLDIQNIFQLTINKMLEYYVSPFQALFLQFHKIDLKGLHNHILNNLTRTKNEVFH